MCSGREQVKSYSLLERSLPVWPESMEIRVCLGDLMFRADGCRRGLAENDRGRSGLSAGNGQLGATCHRFGLIHVAAQKTFEALALVGVVDDAEHSGPGELVAILDRTLDGQSDMEDQRLELTWSDAAPQLWPVQIGTMAVFSGHSVLFEHHSDTVGRAGVTGPDGLCTTVLRRFRFGFSQFADFNNVTVPPKKPGP